jgi:hypothetical protein
MQAPQIVDFTGFAAWKTGQIPVEKVLIFR